MTLLQYVGKLYSVETLDTRFTPSPRTPSSLIDPARPSPREVKSSGDGSQKQLNGGSPPKWKTKEFAVHGLVFLVAVPLMFFTVYQVSQRKSIVGTDLTSLADSVLQLGILAFPYLNLCYPPDGFLVEKWTIPTPNMRASETMSPICSSSWSCTLFCEIYSILCTPYLAWCRRGPTI